MKNSQDDKIFRKVDRCTEKISKKFPDIPIHNLRLIILNLLKPKIWPRKFLLRKIGNKYVP